MSDLTSKKSDTPMFPSGITKLSVGANIATYLAFVTELQGRLAHLTGISDLLRTGQEVDIYEYVLNLYYGSNLSGMTSAKIDEGVPLRTARVSPPVLPFTAIPTWKINPQYRDDMTAEERDEELSRATEVANNTFQAETLSYLERVKNQYWTTAVQEATPSQSDRDELKDMVMKMSQTKEFKAKLILDEIPTVTKQYKIAKTVVTQGLFMGPTKLVHHDIIRRMEEQEGAPVIRNWITSGDLVNLMVVLKKIMLMGPSMRVHESLRESMNVCDFIVNSLWDGKTKSLATFIRTLDSNWEIQRARGGDETVISDSWVASHFINQLAQDPELADFVKEWRYEGKPLPIGGYATLKLQLATFMEIHKLEADYGFQVATGSGSSKKAASYGEANFGGSGSPAINATAADSSKKATKKKPPGWVDVCHFCLAVGHTTDVCRSWAAAGKPKITTEQVQAARDKVKKVREKQQHSEVKKGGITPGSHATTRKVTIAASDSSAKVQSGVFLRFPTSTIMSTSPASSKTLVDNNGVPVALHDLIMWDNGANANGYLSGSILDMHNIVELTEALPVNTTNGQVVVRQAGFNPLVGDYFMFFDNAPCCILAEGRAVDMGWKVAYEPPTKTCLQPSYVDVTIQSKPLRFMRYSNNLFYLRLSELIDTLQQPLLDSPTVAITTRSQTGTPVGRSYARQLKKAREPKQFVPPVPERSLGEASPVATDLSYQHLKELTDNSGEVGFNKPQVQSPVLHPAGAVEDHLLEQSPTPVVDISESSITVPHRNTLEDAVPTSPLAGPIDSIIQPSNAEAISDDPVFTVGPVSDNSSTNPPTQSGVPGASSDSDEQIDYFADYVTRGTAAGYSKDTLEKDIIQLSDYIYKLHVAMGCMPYDRLAEMVGLGKLTGMRGLTAKMVRMAAQRLPPCDICTKVKFRPGASRSTRWYSGVQTDSDPHNLRVDLMFTRAGRKAKSPVLITTDEITGFTNLAYLNSRSTRDVEAAMKKMIAFLEKHGIGVGTIKSDREGAFIEMGKDKYRFEYTAGPGSHDSVAEATIRALKELFVCKREGLSFHLPKSLYPRLMEHVCVLYNNRLRRGATETPWELITGKTVGAEDLIQGAFGRIGLFKIPDEEVKKRKLDDLEPHTEYGVVIGFEPATPRNLRVYLPARREIVSRRGGAAVSNPQPIIDLMNKIASEEDGGTVDTDASSDVFVQTFYGLYTQQEPFSSLPSIINVSDMDNNSISTLASFSTTAPDHTPNSPKLNPLTGSDGGYYIPTGTLDNMTISQAKALLPANLVHDAVIKELVDNMSQYDVWKYCLPGDTIGKHILPSKFFLKSKFLPSGQFDKLKGRLVGGGHLQKSNEFERTSSPTVDFSSFCLLVSLARYLKASVATVDVPAAYLHTPLKQPLYMRLKRDIAEILVQNDPTLAQYVCSDGSIVVQLNKCLYGLKQSGAEWHDLLVEFLLSVGYTQSLTDRCVFFKTHRGGNIDVLCVHVDDLCFVYTDVADFQRVKQLFVQRFGPMQFVEGNTHNYLGMVLLVLDNGAVYLSQIGYTRSLVSQYCQWRGLVQANLRRYKTPSSDQLMELKLQDDCTDRALRDKVFSVVYSLMYLAQRTRPDILFTVTYMTTIVDRPPADIIKHLDHLFGYLSATINRGILLGAVDTGITVYADASYAIHHDGKSHTGIFIMMGENGDGGPILTQSIKQKLVTLSSTEAELAALVDSLKKLQPIRRLLDELNLLSSNPVCVKQDNKSTITIGKAGEGYSGKSKHMRVRYHAIAEQVINGEIELSHCPTIKMVADILTKPGGGSNFADLVEAILANIDD